jgi:hypothetical protein
LKTTEKMLRYHLLLLLLLLLTWPCVRGSGCAAARAADMDEATAAALL